MEGQKSVYRSKRISSILFLFLLFFLFKFANLTVLPALENTFQSVIYNE